MMSLEFVPVKGQTFDIGRTINFTKCNCEKCDFMNCPNYAKKMTVKKFKNAKEFVESWKQQNPQIANTVNKNHEAFSELIEDFMDRMTSFPKGLYWKPEHSWTNPKEVISIDIVRMSKTRYEREQEGDFVTISTVCFKQNFDRTKYSAYHSWYSYGTDRADKLAERIADGLNKVFAELGVGGE